MEMKKILAGKNILRSNYYVDSFALSLMKSMHFSMREANDYLGQVPLVAEKCKMAINDCWNYSNEGFAYICYPIVLFALSLTDRKKYNAFKNGEGEELLLILLF